MELLYTVEETAKILKTDKNYIYKLIKAGVLPVIKLKSYKIRGTAIEDFVRKFEGYDLTEPTDIKQI